MIFSELIKKLYIWKPENLSDFTIQEDEFKFARVSLGSNNEYSSDENNSKPDIKCLELKIDYDEKVKF